MSLHEKLAEYFLTPTVNPYTPDKILIYLTFLLLAIMLIYKLLIKLNIKIDFKFIMALLPLVLFSGELRAMQDQGIVQSVLFVTPWIYVIYFVTAIALILVSKLLGKILRKDYT